VEDEGESSEGRGSGGGGRNHRLGLATAAASSGEIPANLEAMWRGECARVLKVERGVRWCAQNAWGGAPFIGEREERKSPVGHQCRRCYSGAEAWAWSEDGAASSGGPRGGPGAAGGGRERAATSVSVRYCGGWSSTVTMATGLSGPNGHVWEGAGVLVSA
jgi:hypothetical protein